MPIKLTTRVATICSLLPFTVALTQPSPVALRSPTPPTTPAPTWLVRGMQHLRGGSDMLLRNPRNKRSVFAVDSSNAGQLAFALAGASATVQATSPPAKESLMTKIKNSGVAGLCSFALMELLYWGFSFSLAMYTGGIPSMANQAATAKVTAVLVAASGIGQLLMPLRIALALATAPFVDRVILRRLGFGKKQVEEQ